MKTTNFTAQQVSDQWYIMNIALLECVTQEKINYDDVMIYASKKTAGVYYIISRKFENGKPVKTWFKKDFNN